MLYQQAGELRAPYPGAVLHIHLSVLGLRYQHFRKHPTPTRRLLPLLGLRKEYPSVPQRLDPPTAVTINLLTQMSASLYRRDLGSDRSKSSVSLREQIFAMAVQHNPISYRHLRSASRSEAGPCPNTVLFTKLAMASFKSGWKYVDVISVHTG